MDIDEIKAFVGDGKFRLSLHAEMEYRRMTQNEKCHYCGSEQFQTRLVRYIYSRDNQDLLVPQMPVMDYALPD